MKAKYEEEYHIQQLLDRILPGIDFGCVLEVDEWGEGSIRAHWGIPAPGPSPVGISRIQCDFLITEGFVGKKERRVDVAEYGWAGVFYTYEFTEKALERMGL